MAFYSALKSLLFRLDPEKAHDLCMGIFEKHPRAAMTLPRALPDNKYRLSDGSMSWNFPVGLAAGFDKNARAVDFLSRIGFGAIEVGTITPKPQIGNPKPRIKRLTAQKSLVNSMGFPNDGQIRIAKRIEESSWTHGCLLGANLGKNKLTNPTNTPWDYAVLYEAFAPISDYLVINISSPNTPGLRSLQSEDGFRAICEAVDEKRKTFSKPLYLKIAPEIAKSDLADMIELCKEFKFSGIIATNTSVKHNQGPGGLSGELIREESRAARELVLEMTRETPEISVIGAGGISTFEDLLTFWKKGGKMAQIYTSFIYHGPGILKDFQKGIDRLLRDSQASTLQEWIDSLP